MLTKADFHLIERRVGRWAEDYNIAQPSDAFLRLILCQHFSLTPEECSEAICDGPKDAGVDAVIITEVADRVEVSIVQSKYHTSIDKTSKSVPETECHKLSTFIRCLLAFDKDYFENKSDALKERVHAIWSFLERGVPCDFLIFFCTNGRLVTSEGQKILASLKEEARVRSIIQLGPREIINAVVEGGRQPASGILKAITKQIYSRSDGDIKGIVASIDATSLMQLISNSSGTAPGREHFDDNIRVYLGASGQYNASISSSAAAEDNHLFWYLNNGITITCQAFDYNPTVNPIIRLEKFQIVNGAQTCHALFEAYSRNPEALQDVEILARIYETRRSDIAARVAISTNSQHRIQPRDLRSNDDVQKLYEALFAESGLFYERKKNQHSDKPYAQRLDALRLGQIILTYYLSEPDKAKTESDSIFGSRYGLIFRKDHDFNQLTDVIRVFDIVEAKKEEFRVHHGTYREVSDPNSCLIYGHWFVLYAVRLICRSEGIFCPPRDKMEAYVLRAIEVVDRAARQKRAVAQYNIFRSPRFREKIEQEFEGLQLELFPF